LAYASQVAVRVLIGVFKRPKYRDRGDDGLRDWFKASNEWKGTCERQRDNATQTAPERLNHYAYSSASSHGTELQMGCVRFSSNVRRMDTVRLQAHLDRRGDGDVGPALRVPRGSTRCCTPSWSPHSLPETILGPGEIVRMGYSCVGAPSIYPPGTRLAHSLVLLRTAAAFGPRGGAEV
jgi:hypothetical protein